MAQLKKTNPVHTVILDGRKLRTPQGLVTNGPVRYVCFADNSPKARNNTPEFLEVWLQPGGPNHNLSDEQIAILKNSEIGKEHIAAGIITIISPKDLEKASGTSADYDEAEAIALIRDSEDRDWLEESRAKEDRPAVREQIGKQLDAIDQRLVTLRKQAANATE